MKKLSLLAAVTAILIVAFMLSCGDNGGSPACVDNDGDASIYPGAPTVCGDGVDQDCNKGGQVYTLDKFKLRKI